MSIGGKNQPAGNTTTSTTSAPWSGASGYLTGTLYPKALNIGNTPQTYFPGQTYASPTGQQNQAIAAQTQLAQNDPTMQAATGGIQPYLNGSMLSAGNPYFGNVVSQLGQAIAPSIDSQFNMNGRAGSGANNQAFASALTNEAGQMAYNNYNDQSTNQLKAMLLAPQISGGNFNDIAQLGAAGAQQQAFNQLPITQAMNQYFYNQQAPYNQASEMANLLGVGMGQNSATSSPYFTNPVGNALSTGIGALSLYNMGNQATGGGLNGGVSSLWSSLFGGGGAGLTGSELSTLAATSPGDI